MASETVCDDQTRVIANFEIVSSMLDEGVELYNEITSASQSSKEKGLLRKAIDLLEEVTRRVSDSNLFTTFKSLHDVPTSHLKLFIIPALLGLLNLKLWHSDRTEIIHVAQAYFRDFLDRARSFGLLDERPPDATCASQVVETPSPPSEVLKLEDINCQRDAKLLRHTQQVAMQTHIADLKVKLEKLEQLIRSTTETIGLQSKKSLERRRVEKKMRRNYYVTLVRSFANQVIEEMEIMEWEKLVINYMAKMRVGPPFVQREMKDKLGKIPQMKISKPILITNGQLLDKTSAAELKECHRRMHGKFYNIVFQNPLVPYPITPRPSVVIPQEEVTHQDAVVEEKEPEPEVEQTSKEPEMSEGRMIDDAKAQRDKTKGKKKTR